MSKPLQCWEFFPEHRKAILRCFTISLVAISVVFSALFLPEMFIGRSFWLRILFGVIFTSSATALAFGISKLFRLVPSVPASAFIGAWVIVGWCIFNVISVFAILPFSTSWLMTMAASLIISLVLLTIIALLGALFAIHPKTTGLLIMIAIVITSIALWTEKSTLENDASNNVHTLMTGSVTLDAPYPADTGKFWVKTLYYGSGMDRHRPEYGANADLKTGPVDASPFIPEGWSIARTRYWGFDQTRLPVNGNVWFPDGGGPFPLVLIVHGAYEMTKFSEVGFAYLGELLASRGYIVVAVDENFLNYGWHRYGDFKESDIDARGWLLLKHLRVWQEWNKDERSPFYKKIDMSRIALIGHSRGGEAIAAAAAFNRMKRYPKNGDIIFDFNFNIRTLIAFAPSDIYQPPYERTTPIEIKKLNYLLLQGTYDRQAPSIMGSRIYQRVSLDGNADGDCNVSEDGLRKHESYIKAALYISRANHSQFNTMWGIYDLPWPYRLFANVTEQLSGAEQRRIAKIYVSAFLDATLKGDKRYIPLFRDYRFVEGWLPKTAYISRFQDSRFRTIANFDEDIDPDTTTVSGGRIIGRNLSRWHEEDIDYHYYLPYGSRSNRVVSVSWDAQNESPVLGFKLPDKLVENWKLKSTDMLVFSIASPEQLTAPELSIELRDARGRISRLPLNRSFQLKAPLHSYLTRMSLLEEPSPVIVLQTVSIPLSQFLALNHSLDMGKLRDVDFRFDNRKSGTVLLDDIGFDQ